MFLDWAQWSWVSSERLNALTVWAALKGQDTKKRPWPSNSLPFLVILQNPRCHCCRVRALLPAVSPGLELISLSLSLSQFASAPLPFPHFLIDVRIVVEM